MASATEFTGCQSQGRAKTGSRRSWFEFRRKISFGDRVGLGIVAWVVSRGVVKKSHLMGAGVEHAPIPTVVSEMKAMDK